MRVLNGADTLGLMLLDSAALLLGVGLAAAGFIVVVVVSATVLRLIGFVLGDGEVDGEPDEAASTGAEGMAAEGTASQAGDAEPRGAPDPG